MSKSPRIAIPGYPHHISERGIRKTPLFYDDSDFLVYTRTMKTACDKHCLKIGTYTLMPNHIHIIAVPEHEDSLSGALQQAHTAYSKYFNTKYGFVGHAWDRRPYYCAMDEAHMWNAIRYVERNPVRAGLVERAEDYLWSSAAAHCGRRDDILIAVDFPPPGIIANWSEWLRVDHSEEQKKAIRKHLSTGRPMGAPEFLIQLETLTGKELQLRKRGRPKKVASDCPARLFEK
jgi:putative transposase